MIALLHCKISELLTNRSPEVLLTFSTLLLLLLGLLDLVTGDFSLIIFYLLPVSLVAWFVSKRSGIWFCVFSAAIRLIVDEGPESFTFDHSMIHYWNDLIEFIFLLMMSLLFSALKSNLDNAKELASRDHLTGALNRRSFFDLAEHEINRSRRYGFPFTVGYIDLDDFKEVNDRLGHRAGDELLSMVVSTIRCNIRSTDILARFGGDEFVILLPETSGDVARLFLNKLHEHLNDAMRINNWPVSFSVGAITYLQAPATVDEAIH